MRVTFGVLIVSSVCFIANGQTPLPVLSNIETTQSLSNNAYTNTNHVDVLSDSRLMFDSNDQSYNNTNSDDQTITIKSRRQTIPYFEMRRLNAYYRDMEEWRRQERLRLKRYGLYDRASIEELYAQ